MKSRDRRSKDEKRVKVALVSSTLFCFATESSEENEEGFRFYGYFVAIFLFFTICVGLQKGGLEVEDIRLTCQR